MHAPGMDTVTLLFVLQLVHSRYRAPGGVSVCAGACGPCDVVELLFAGGGAPVSLTDI